MNVERLESEFEKIRELSDSRFEDQGHLIQSNADAIRDLTHSQETTNGKLDALVKTIGEDRDATLKHRDAIQSLLLSPNPEHPGVLFRMAAVENFCGRIKRGISWIWGVFGTLAAGGMAWVISQFGKGTQ